MCACAFRLGQLITLSGIDQSSMPFSAPLPNPTNLSKHERLANLTTGFNATSLEADEQRKSPGDFQLPPQRQAPPAEPVFSPAFEAMMAQQQAPKDVTHDAPLPDTDNKFDELYSKVLEETEGALKIQSNGNEKPASLLPGSHHSIGSQHSSKHSSRHSSKHSRHGAMQLDDLRVEKQMNDEEDDEDEISEEILSVHTDDDSF